MTASCASRGRSPTSTEHDSRRAQWPGAGLRQDSDVRAGRRDRRRATAADGPAARRRLRRLPAAHVAARAAGRLHRARTPRGRPPPEVLALADEDLLARARRGTGRGRAHRPRSSQRPRPPAAARRRERGGARGRLPPRDDYPRRLPTTSRPSAPAGDAVRLAGLVRAARGPGRGGGRDAAGVARRPGGRAGARPGAGRRRRDGGSGMALGVDSAAHAARCRPAARRWRCSPAAPTSPTRLQARAARPDPRRRRASCRSPRRASCRAAGASRPATGSSPALASATIVVAGRRCAPAR